MLRDEIAALHAKTRLHKARVEDARRIVAEALTLDAAPYVAFSGGKDSTVVAALVREQAPDTPLVWSDDEWYLPETGEYMERVRASGAELHAIRTNAWHAEWLQVAGDYGGIPEYAAGHGWLLAFLGLRQEESGKRRVHLRRFGPLHYAESNKQWQCNPIHAWSWRDVWAYIVAHELDYNRAYDVLERIGIPSERQRVGPLAVERALGYGQIAILKRGWPDLWNRFVSEHPEAGGYT